jgi:hypothetical protein
METAFDSTTLLQHKLILGILGTLICMGIMVKIVFHIELNSRPKRKRDKKRRIDKIIENNLSELTLSASITKSGSRDGDDDNSTSQQSYNKKEQVINFPTNFPPGLSDDVQIHARSDSFDDDESVVSYTSMKDDHGVRQTSTYHRKRLSFMDKLGTYFYISLLTFLNYLLLVYLPAGIGFSMTGMVLTTVVVLKSHIADELRRKRMDRIAALFALMFFTASFLSLARFATEGLHEGEIYEGPARIVGYDQERYGDVVGGSLRMDLVVQFGGEWACPANPSKQCQAEVSGALCQQSENDVIAKQGPSTRRYLSDQKDGRKLEDLNEYIDELDGEEEAENEELLKDEENGIDDAIIAVEEVLVDELDEEITDMSIEEEKNAEIESIDQEKVVVEEQLLNDHDKEAVEIAFDTEEDTVEKDYNDFEESVNEEYDEAIESLEGENVNGTSSQEEEEIEDLKEELDYYVEKSKEEEEDNQELTENYVTEYYTKEDLENELVKEEVKAENMTANQAYLDVINKTATYENEEEELVKSYYNDYNVQQKAGETYQDEGETYQDEAYYAIENLFFDDDFFADEYWNYGWNSVWGDYACSDLFDNDLEGKAFDADEVPGGDDWPFINVYGTCNSCKAFLVDFYTQEHFDQIRRYQIHAIHYFIMGFVASLFYAALALKQWIAPSEENKVTLLMTEAEIA